MVCFTERKSSVGEGESASEADNSMQALVEQSPAVIFRNGRQKVSKNIPSHEQLMAIKCKKKVSLVHYNMVVIQRKNGEK